MSVDRTEGRRANQRAFRPTVGGGLERRLLLSTAKHHFPGAVMVANPKVGFAYINQQPKFLSAGAPHFDRHIVKNKPLISGQTLHGGQGVRVIVNGAGFNITLVPFTPGTTATASATTSTTTTSTSPNTPTVTGPVQVPGTVRVYPLSNQQVGIIVDGSTQFTELDIAPATFPQRKGYAHSFAYGRAGRDVMLKVGAIIINSGNIAAINGFHTTDLYGPITDNGTYTVDRIALNSIQPGGSIQTGGDLNTLDIATSATLSGPAGNVTIGRDLNLLNVGQNLTMTNGGNFTINRDLGLIPQPPKGTGDGSNFLSLNQSFAGTGVTTLFPNVAGKVLGNMVIGPGSAFTVGGRIGQSIFFVGGSVSGAFRLNIPNGVFATSINSLPPPNFVAQGGFTA